MIGSKWLIAAAAVTLIAAAPSAMGNIIAYDGMDYTVGGMLYNQGAAGNGWLGPWSKGIWNSEGQNVIVAPTLSYGALQVSGNAVEQLPNKAGHIHRRLDGLFCEPNSGEEVWGSYLIQGNADIADPTKAGGFSLWYLPNPNDVNNRKEHLSGGVNPNSNKWYVTMQADYGTTRSVDFGNYDGNTHMWLFKVVASTGSNKDGICYVWFDPDLSSEPSIDDADAALTGITQFNAISFMHHDTKHGTWEIRGDEVRIGETFRDVAPVPEPATLALLGLGGLGLLVRRKRVALKDV